MRELIGTLILGLLVYLAGRWNGYKWGQKEAREDHILCTPKQVVEAVLTEYRALPRLREVAPGRIVSEPLTSAERIAANLVQLTEKGR
jgi:hypothetical protein